MRLFEVLLWLGELLTFVLLAVSPRVEARPARLAAAVTVLIAAAQIAVEGSRWQMVPAYALAGIFMLASLLIRTSEPGHRAANTWTSHILWGLGLAVGGLALAVCLTLPLLVPVFRFPQPSGPYALGTLTFHWVDEKRPEILSARTDDKRELMAQVWYPAQAQPQGQRASYIANDMNFSVLTRAMHLPDFFFDHLQYVTGNAVQGAPMIAGEERFPVLIFAAGNSGFRQHNTFQVEELASHGYVVVAMDQPYAAAEVIFPDGRHVEHDQRLNNEPAGRAFANSIFPYLGQDPTTVLNELEELVQADSKHFLAHRLDLTKVAVFGPSLGGIVAAEACRQDERFRACLAMDVLMPADVVEAGIRQPMMWISRGADDMRREGWPDDEIQEHQQTMHAVFEKGPGPGYLLQIAGLYHVNTTDFPLFLASPAARALNVIGPVDPDRAHAIINAYSLAFFDRYLKGASADLLDAPSRAFPEVTMETLRTETTEPLPSAATDPLSSETTDPLPSETTGPLRPGTTVPTS